MRILCPLLLSALLAVSTEAAEAVKGSMAAEFAVKATVDSFTGTVKSEALSLEPGAAGDLLTVTVPIASMMTGKPKRDVEMQHMFHSDLFPDIVGTVRSADLEALKQDTGAAASLPLTLVISGVTNELSATVSSVKHSEGKVSLDAEFAVLLKTFGLKPPSVMGLIRVNNEVKVKAHVEWAR